jgi:acetyl-CoA carboxylase carboxyltransferase component
MAEMVIGEKVTLEELGGARMHCSVSGCADFLCQGEEEAIAQARRWFAFFPGSCRDLPPAAPARPPRPGQRPVEEIIPADQNKPYDVHDLVSHLVDEGSFLEVKKLWAGEIVTGLARIEGRAVGILANQPKVKGGVLFVDSADKAARFIWLCDAFHIPLLYLADVPGFMIGTKVERAGIIRAGAKMISAVSEATVPRISVVVRKAYGAGLYAMDGPAFGPSCCLALPQAMIAVMGPEAAVNAVYFNKIQERPEGERADYVKALREEYQRDIDIHKLASELVIDAVVPGKALRAELARRFDFYAQGYQPPPGRKRGVLPV